MQLIEAKGLGCRYGDFVALQALDFAVQPGEACVLVGPNGAGKSTALKILSGLESESEGVIRVLGERPRSAPRAWRSRIGVLPENLGLFDALSIAEHLRLSGQMFSLPPEQLRLRSEELLEILGLTALSSRFAATCSYGMRKKTALALALLHAPKVLLLDEPFEGLDPASCETVLLLLQRAMAAGVGLVVSSHMLMHVERLASEVILLSQGAAVWRSHNPAQGLREHYLQVVRPAPLPPMEWLNSEWQ
jgi:ABC-2 type transport system ATP-binding protein